MATLTIFQLIFCMLLHRLCKYTVYGKEIKFLDQALNQINLITKGDEKNILESLFKVEDTALKRMVLLKSNEDDIIFGKTIIDNSLILFLICSWFKKEMMESHL